MKKLLYTLPMTATKEIFQRYSEKVPEPLNTQFTDRETRKTAVQKHEERTKKRAELHFFHQVLCHILDASIIFAGISFRPILISSIISFCVIRAETLVVFTFSHAGEEQESLLQSTSNSCDIITRVRTAQRSRKYSKCKRPGHTKGTCQGT